MPLKITVIGTGGAVSTKNTNPSGFLLEAEGKRILLDCGTGIVRRLLDEGINPQTLDALALSHFHPDHFSDAFPLIVSRFVDDLHKGRKNKKLILYGPRGLRKRFKAWRKIFWLEPNEHYPLEFKEGIFKTRLGSVRLETFAVTHVPYFQSVGFKIKHYKKKIIYTGDIGSSHNINSLIKTCQNADLLIIEGTWVKRESPNHFSVVQIEKLAVQARIKKVLIVHTAPGQINKVAEYIRKNKKLVMARHGQRLLA